MAALRRLSIVQNCSECPGYFIVNKTGPKTIKCVSCRERRKRITDSSREKERYWSGTSWIKKNPEKAKASHRRYRTHNAALNLWRKAKKRAFDRSLPFDLEVSDIAIPSHCPVLGLAIVSEKRGGIQGDACPTIDRIVPERGYVKGNVAVISWRANKLKSDATLDEIGRLHSWLIKAGG